MLDERNIPGNNQHILGDNEKLEHLHRSTVSLDLEHVFDFYWVFRAIENRSNIIRIIFLHKSLRDPHRGGPYINLQCTHVINVATVEDSRRLPGCHLLHATHVSNFQMQATQISICRMRRKCCAAMLVVCYALLRMRSLSI
jgi:hypothetical protein